MAGLLADRRAGRRTDRRTAGAGPRARRPHLDRRVRASPNIRCPRDVRRAAARRAGSLRHRPCGARAVEHGADAAAVPALLRRLSRVDEAWRSWTQPARRCGTGGCARRSPNYMRSQCNPATGNSPNSAGRRHGSCRDGRGRRRCAEAEACTSTGATIRQHTAAARLYWRRYGSGPVNALHRSCSRGYLPRLAAPARTVAVTSDSTGDAASSSGRSDRRGRRVVAAIEPGLSSPGVESRDVVLVAGPVAGGYHQSDHRVARPVARARRSSRPTN